MTGRYVYKVTGTQDRQPVGDQRPGRQPRPDPDADVVPPEVLGQPADHRLGRLRPGLVLTAPGQGARRRCRPRRPPRPPRHRPRCPARTTPPSRRLRPPAAADDRGHHDRRAGTFNDGLGQRPGGLAARRALGRRAVGHRLRRLAARQAHPAVGGHPASPSCRSSSSSTSSSRTSTASYRPTSEATAPPLGHFSGAWHGEPTRRASAALEPGRALRQEGGRALPGVLARPDRSKRGLHLGIGRPSGERRSRASLCPATLSGASSAMRSAQASASSVPPIRWTSPSVVAALRAASARRPAASPGPPTRR